jgi:hypothetical protein
MIGEQYSVLSGLDADTSVVADGSFKVRDGALIAAIPSASLEASKATPTASQETARQETAGK